MHKFNPDKLKKLDDPERLSLFDPEAVLKSFGLKPGMTVLDVGTGAGFYLPYLSKMVSDSGKVYAIDISPEAVEYAKSKVSQLGLKNVEVLLSQENKIPLPNNTVDFTYMAFVFHELEDPVKFLKELERVSKPISYLAFIDWKKEERDKGTPPDRVGRVVEVGPYVYGFYAMFVKQ